MYSCKDYRCSYQIAGRQLDKAPLQFHTVERRVEQHMPMLFSDRLAVTKLAVAPYWHVFCLALGSLQIKFNLKL